MIAMPSPQPRQPSSLSRTVASIVGGLALLVLTAGPPLHAQEGDGLFGDRRVTLNADGTLLEDIVDYLARETGIAFDLEDGIGERELFGEAKDLPLGEALRLLLGSAGLEYEIDDDRVVIRRDPDAPPPPAPKDEPPPPPSEVSLENLIRRGEYARAEKMIRADLEARPEELPLTLSLATILEETGRYGEAVDLLEEAIGLHSEEKDLLLRLGRLYLRTGRYPEAEGRLKACPDLLPARAALGHLYLERLGEREEGRRLLEGVVGAVSRRDPRSDELVAAGEASAALGRQEEASRFFSRAGREDPERVEPYLRLAELWLGNYEQSEAIRLVERALEIRPTLPEARVLRARCLLMNRLLGTGRYALALGEIGQALQVNPFLPEAHLLLGEIHIFDGAYGDAADQIRQVLGVNPHSIPARAALAAMHLLREEEEEVKALSAAVLAQNPRAYRFFLGTGDILETRFRYQEAANLARKAIELEPESGEAHSLLGRNLLRLGEMEEGEEALRKAQSLDTNLFVRNALRLLEELREEYETFLDPHFEIRIHRREAPVLLPYVRAMLEEARTSLGERYGFLPKERVLVEVYADHPSFSARTMGLPWVSALGVCFGKVMAIDSPTAMEDPHGGGGGAPGEKRKAVFSWGRTLWHEYTHVVTLLATKNRCPRWLTEGLSVLEEGRARPGWDRAGEMAVPFFTALAQGRLLGVGELDRGFTKPEFGGQVLLSYYQGSMVCGYIEERFGMEALRGLLEGYSRSLGTEAVFREVLEIDLETFDRDFLAHCREWQETTGFRPSCSPAQLAERQAVFEASPEDASLAARLARACLDLGLLGKAELYAARAVELDPDLGDAQAVFGQVRVRRGATADGEEALQRALVLGCDDLLRVHVELARLSEKGGDTSRAYEHLLAASKLFPMDARISRAIATIHLDSEAKEAAVPYLEAAARWDAYDLWSRRKVLEIYSDRGKDEEVARIGLELIALDPFGGDLHFRLGEALRRLGRRPEALREYQVAIALHHFEEGEIAIGQAEIFLEEGDLVRARERAERALEIAPGSPRAARVMEVLNARDPGKRKEGD